MTQKTLGQWTDRPKHNCDAVYEKATDAILSKVLDWLKEGDWTGDESEVRKEIRELMDRAYYCDGYELTRDLERDGWAVNSDLVDILNDAGWEVSKAHDSLVEEWVKANNVKPELAIGDKVIATTNRDGDVEGEITKIFEFRGQYCVCCPSLGHVKEATKSGVPHGVLVDYERTRLSRN